MKPNFFLILLMFLSFFGCISQIMYLNETYSGPITNGSNAHPFNSLSQLFSQSFSNNIQLILLSDLHCNGSFVNGFGLTLRYIFNFFSGVECKFLIRNQDFFLFTMFVHEKCNLVSSNANLIFQNMNIIFVNTMQFGSPFLVKNQGLLSIEVSILLIVF